MTDRYGRDVLAGPRRTRVEIPEVVAEIGVVVEDLDSGFCGAVVGFEKAREGAAVRLEDRHGRCRLFIMRRGAFLIEGKPVTLTSPSIAPISAIPVRSASGSRRVPGVTARIARASRIWVEGIHDAELVERVWGHDLRVDGIVVEPLHGIDDLADRVAEFGPHAGARLGILVDHLVTGSKESKIARGLGPDVEVTGHPFVDIWQAVRPAAVGISHWPQVPMGEDWKTGVCSRLGWGTPQDGWRRVAGSVSSFRDLEPSLIGAVERLVDFVTVGQSV